MSGKSGKEHKLVPACTWLLWGSGAWGWSSRRTRRHHSTCAGTSGNLCLTGLCKKKIEFTPSQFRRNATTVKKVADQKVHFCLDDVCHKTLPLHFVRPSNALPPKITFLLVLWCVSYIHIHFPCTAQLHRQQTSLSSYFLKRVTCPPTTSGTSTAADRGIY
jgi:hypothetical protein